MLIISAFLRKAGANCNEWGTCRGYGPMTTVLFGSLKVHFFSLPATSFQRPHEGVQQVPLHPLTQRADFLPVCLLTRDNYFVLLKLRTFLCMICIPLFLRVTLLVFFPVTHVVRTTIAFVYVCPYWISPTSLLHK